jgi:thiamine-phosphate pyrophosphorylase
MSDCLLYLISPPIIPDLATFHEQCKAVIGAGGDKIGAFQLRLKQQGSAAGVRLTDLPADDDTIRAATDLLFPLFQQAEISFILNDNATLAAELGVDGVHVGQEDDDISHARQLLGEDAVIGVSCHASRHLAMVAGEAGADYVAFGAFYPTTSKSPESLAHYGTPALDILEWWTSIIEIPCVAIGGITPHNAAPIIEAGADFIAALSSVWQHPVAPEAAVREFLSIL